MTDAAAPAQARIDGRTVTASIVVAAPPEAVFALLANPYRHAEFDGSGTVSGAVSGPDRLAIGDRFGMDMKIALPYRTTNQVVEFEENRQIAWCHFSKARWRYELEPVDGGTRVTETFDYRDSVLPARLFIEAARFPKGNARSIRDTLLRLQALFGAPTA